MHYLAEEMVPLAPIDVIDLDKAYGNDSKHYEQEYRPIMDSVPDRINELYRDRPKNLQLNEIFITCLYNEGCSLQRQLDQSAQTGEVDYLEFLESVRVTHAASLVVQYQIEENVRGFRPKKSTKLPQRERERAEKLYQHYLEKGSLPNNARSSILDSYLATTIDPHLRGY